jgi:predicted dehydrogenase
MAKWNLALVGAGRRGGGAHLPVIPKLSESYNFVAVCDINEAVATEHAERYGVHAYTNLREMVAEENLDVVDVTVPGEAHHAVCVYLAQRGIHVLCETPIASTLTLSDMMIRAAQENGVVLEIAENYYRAPIERFKTELIRAGVVGDVSRIYRIFHEGGYHGMSMLRLRAGGNPVSVLGITHSTPVIPITDRMKRHHTSDNWSLGYLDFDNDVSALMVYSNVIHARSLGRGVRGVSQIDGSAGTIVGDTVYAVPPEDLDKGAVAKPHEPRRVTQTVDGVNALSRIEMELPGQTLAWENPLAHLPLTEGQVAVADELLSVARALDTGRPPEYGAAAGRLDQEMNLAAAESSRQARTTLHFPFEESSESQARTRERFLREYGVPPDDVEGMLDVFFPRR